MPDPYVVPSRRDAVVATASRLIGGPAGRHAVIGARGLAGVAQAVVVIAALMIALGVFQKGHCLVKGWVNPDQFWRACYSDLPVQHVTTGLAERGLPYLDATGWDQPLLSGLTMWALSLVSPVAGTGLAAQQWIFALWAVLAVLLLGLACIAAVSLRPRRPWQAAHLAASPVLVVLALVSTDLVGIALLMWGLWCWRRGQAGWAGALIGLAVLVRPYPLVFLAAIAYVGWRQGRAQPVAQVLIAAALAPLALLLPLMLVHPDGALAPLRGWWLTTPGYGGLQLLPQLLGAPLPGQVSTWVAVLGWVAALALGAWLSRTTRYPPSVVRVAAPMLLVVVLTAKAVPVQSGLWLLPVLALSAVRWRDHLIWAGVEVLHFVMVWLHIGYGSDPGRGLPPETYAFVVLVRMAAWGYVVWRAWSGPIDPRLGVHHAPRRPSSEHALPADPERDPHPSLNPALPTSSERPPPLGSERASGSNATPRGAVRTP